jgi:hypothetical protein
MINGIFFLYHFSLYLVMDCSFTLCLLMIILYVCRKGFWCELTGDLVDEFHKDVLSAADGLPIIVLQFARICIVQGF